MIGIKRSPDRQTLFLVLKKSLVNNARARVNSWAKYCLYIGLGTAGLSMVLIIADAPTWTYVSTSMIYALLLGIYAIVNLPFLLAETLQVVAGLIWMVPGIICNTCCTNCPSLEYAFE